MTSRMRLFLGLAVAVPLHLSGLAAKNIAWETRDAWPTAAQATVVPRAAKTMGVLLGRELAADLLWIRTLVYEGSTIAETGAFDQLEEYIDAVLELDPHFKRIYKWAAYAITFRNETATQEEFELSAKYIELGTKAFPDEYELFWLGGLRYFLDLRPDDKELRQKYKERGMELIEEALKKNDAPKVRLANLAAELGTQLGQRERAIQNLKEAILTTEDPSQRKEIGQRLAILAGEDVADAILSETRRVREEQADLMPFVPQAIYLYVGKPRDLAINFDSLATERDLFGATEIATPAASDP